MQNLDEIKPELPEQGFQFPGVFEITVMGTAGVALETRVPAIIAGLGLTLLAGSERIRPSREGKYVAVTLSFACPSREHYDAAHAALRAEPDIRWTL